MEEFDSEDFSTSDEDEDYVPSGERFVLKREEGCSHASRLTRGSPGSSGRGPRGLAFPWARGSRVPVLRTPAHSLPGTRMGRFCTAALLGRRPLGARELAREAGRLGERTVALKRSGSRSGLWRLFSGTCQPPRRLRLSCLPLGSQVIGLSESSCDSVFCLFAVAIHCSLLRTF